jgi:hypothetical protein
MREQENMLKIFNFIWIGCFCLLGAAVGALCLGELQSTPLSIAGAAVGLVIGGLLGKYIPWEEWFV